MFILRFQFFAYSCKNPKLMHIAAYVKVVQSPVILYADSIA